MTSTYTTRLTVYLKFEFFRIFLTITDVDTYLRKKNFLAILCYATSPDVSWNANSPLIYIRIVASVYKDSTGDK